MSCSDRVRTPSPDARGLVVSRQCCWRTIRGAWFALDLFLFVLFPLLSQSTIFVVSPDLLRWVILFARVPSLYSRYTPFLCLSSDSPYGQRIVAEGLLRRGDKAKVIFDFCCLFLLSPKSNVIAPLLSHYRRDSGNPSMGEGRQAMIPEQGDGWDYGTR